jgi:hypothetical protein
MAAKFKMESYFKDVMKDLEKGAEMQRKKAANYLKDKVKEAALSIADTGALAKSTYVKHLKRSSYVGTRAPHSFLVEFGSNPRFNKENGKYSGEMPANPIVYGTFAKEAPVVEQIMSEPWIG